MHFTPKNKTAAYSVALKKLRHGIQNKRRGLLIYGVILLYDNARPHAARMIQDLIESFDWELMNLLPSALAPSDFHIFLYFKYFLSDQCFNDDEKGEDTLTYQLTSQAAILYDACTQNLLSRHDKSLNVLGDFSKK